VGDDMGLLEGALVMGEDDGIGVGDVVEVWGLG